MILGIVGSPRKGGLTDQLVTRTLEGVKSAGIETKKVHLADFQVPYYSEEAECPQELSRLCEKANALVSRGTIEVAPLAFMRGRTLSDSFVILDEAQNTTVAQMKMFLTRVGQNSKAVITGDVTQVDLPGRTTSGLRDAIRLLADIEGLRCCYFGAEDVVRHPMVQRIVEAYEERDERHQVANCRPDHQPVVRRQTVQGEHRHLRRQRAVE